MRHKCPFLAEENDEEPLKIKKEVPGATKVSEEEAWAGNGSGEYEKSKMIYKAFQSSALSRIQKYHQGIFEYDQSVASLLLLNCIFMFQRS